MEHGDRRTSVIRHRLLCDRDDFRHVAKNRNVFLEDGRSDELRPAANRDETLGADVVGDESRHNMLLNRSSHR